MNKDIQQNPADVYTVTRLNREARLFLETQFNQICLIGEISNFLHHQSGHMYFSLKDEAAQIRAAMFRHSNQGLNFTPENGQQILAYGKVSVYEGRGDYQLIVTRLEPVGDGALQRAFNQLKAKLEKEGLFAADRKQTIPELPHTIGVITSSTGAAIHDILTTLKKRFPAIPVIIYPTEVQGKQAAPSIVQALQQASKHQACDVLILARGGGSLEDLWAFNEESVARAIADCPIPVVSGIGHEIDFTIADFVADYRAPTPTGAAEAITPDWRSWLEQLMALQQRCIYLIQQQLQQQHALLTHLSKRLRNPLHLLAEYQQRLDYLSLQLTTAIKQSVDQAAFVFRQLIAKLETVSPLATLQRGYAIAQDKQGNILTKAKHCQLGDELLVTLSQDKLLCTVKDINP